MSAVAGWIWGAGGEQQGSSCAAFAQRMGGGVGSGVAVGAGEQPAMSVAGAVTGLQPLRSSPWQSTAQSLGAFDGWGHPAGWGVNLV